MAIRCHILKLKCSKSDLGWGTPLGELTALPDPIAGFNGSTSKGRGGPERRGGMGVSECVGS